MCSSQPESVGLSFHKVLDTPVPTKTPRPTVKAHGTMQGGFHSNKTSEKHPENCCIEDKVCYTIAIFTPTTTMSVGAVAVTPPVDSHTGVHCKAVGVLSTMSSISLSNFSYLLVLVVQNISSVYGSWSIKVRDVTGQMFRVAVSTP